MTGRYDDDEWTAGDFSALSTTQCQQLLATQSVGRVAWQAADGPQVLPVTYVWHEGRVVFRTSPYGVLSELVRPTEVALEIDELDVVRHEGWSVVVQGRAEGVAEPEALSAMWAIDGVVPWAAGSRNLFIQVTPRKVSGRSLTRSARER